MIVFDPAKDRDLVRHLTHALRTHSRWLRNNAIQPPAGWTELTEHLAATTGQDRPTFDGIDSIANPLITPPALLTMREARDLLAVSERTLRRLVASGRLAAVNVDGCRRIRRADLDNYIANLPTTRETTA